MSILSVFIASLPGAVAQGIIWGVMAIGLYITFKIINLSDLTVDGSFATGGAVLTVCMVSGLNVYLSMLIAFASGCIAGLVTGLLHTKFGIPAILSGILTQLALFSVNLRVMSGKANSPLPSGQYKVLLSLSSTRNSIMISLGVVLVIIAVLYWFFGTEMGHSIRATGCNSAMASANGINNNLNKVFAFVLSNGLVALSGALFSQYQGYADVNMGRGAIVIGLAAIIIGEVLFSKLFKNFALRLLAVVFGSIIYYAVINLVLALGLNTNDLKLFSALIVALFIGVTHWKKIYGEKHKKKA